MNHIEDLVTWLHEDPETLPGAPSNLVLVECFGDPLQRKVIQDLTPAERQGFLEIWQMSYVGEMLRYMFTDDLEATKSAARAELDTGTTPERRALDLRFLHNKVSAEISSRFYQGT